MELFSPLAFLQILLWQTNFALYFHPSKCFFYFQKGLLLKRISNFRMSKFPPTTFMQLMRVLAAQFVVVGVFLNINKWK